MTSHVAYRCISCGRDIVSEETVDVTDAYLCTASATLRHDGPMDAACRLVFEALRDDIAQTLDRRIVSVTNAPWL